MKNAISIKFYKLFFFLILFTSAANAQIIFTDIPDTTIRRSTNQTGTESFVLNLDNDTNPDFNFGARSQIINSTGCTVTPSFETNLFAWVGTMPGYSNQVGDSAGYTAIVNFNALIDASAFVWNVSSQNYFINHSYTLASCIWDSSFAGYWTDSITGYAALKFKKGAFTYYGWVHITVQKELIGSNDHQVSITIMDYAYNSVPDEAIRAGDTNVGIENLLDDESDFSVYPNPAFREITIENKSRQNLQFTLYNSLGEKIISRELTNKISFDLSAYPQGIYFYDLSSNNRIIKAGKLIRQ